MPGALEPLSASEVAVLDAKYPGIPAFRDWFTNVPHTEAWQRACQELAELKVASSPQQLDAAVTIARRMAAFDTGAIEGLYSTDRGLTRTVAEQAAMWEQAVEQRSDNALALFEAQLRAYELVLDVATKAMPISEAWIRRLHEELTEPQETYTVHTPIGPQEQPLPRGEYKRYPNHVESADGEIHPYAPVDRTSAEMQRLVSELSGDDFQQAHPILQASYAHYALVAIHPFADGNGRVARALASVYLYRATSVPLMILADQRSEYFATLESADRGDLEPFVAFVSDAARAAIAIVADTLSTAVSPRPEDAVQGLRALQTAPGGLSHEELDRAASALVTELIATIENRLGELDLPSGIVAQVGSGSGSASVKLPRGYRTVVSRGSSFAFLQLESAAPARAQRNLPVFVLISIDGSDYETFVLSEQPIRGGEASGSPAAFDLRDVYPQLSVAAQIRLRAYTDRVLGHELSQLEQEARTAMEQRKTE